MELDYNTLRQKAENLAESKAAMMYPLGRKKDEERTRLTDEYYRQYITPPNQHR